MNESHHYLLQTPPEVASMLASRARELRLARNWKQVTLAERAGVTLASLRRFEQTGQVSLQHLLKLAMALGRLGDFDSLLQPPPATSIAELEETASQQKPQRGTR